MTKLLDGFFGERIENKVSLIKDPFETSCIQRVYMVSYRNWDGKTFTTYGVVEFQNGNTKGEQKIEAQNLGELIEKVYKFCETLK